MAERCPNCSGELEYDEVDIGVGVERGNYFCPDCHWSPGWGDKALDWNLLIFGSYSHLEVDIAVGNVTWQYFRASLLNTDHKVKFRRLFEYLRNETRVPLELKQVQVTNYVNALKRGGLI